MYYSQNDPRWSGRALGFGPDSIGTDGCYLTSDADLLSWTGTRMDPGQLNEHYRANGIFVASELLQDSALHVAFPDLWTLEETYHCESIPCDQAKLDNDDPNLYVLIEILGPRGTTHFCPVTNWRAWKIADTWDGIERTVAQRGAGWGWGTDPAHLIGKVMRLRFTGGGAPPPVVTAVPGTFPATVDTGGAHVRVLPGTDQAIVQQPGAGDPDIVNGGVVLTFDAWCHHTPRGGQDMMPMDAGYTPARPDDRWFRVQGTGHWMASATLSGNPPAGMEPVPDPSPPPAPVVVLPVPAPAPAPAPAPLPVPPVPLMESYRDPGAVWKGQGLVNFILDRCDRVGGTRWDSGGDPNAALAGPSYDLGRGGYVVLHHMDGTANGADARFHDATQEASAHYGVLQSGEVWQWVNEADASMGSGNYAVNRMAINIEVEDGGKDTYTPAQLAALTRLVTGICRRYGIPAQQADVRHTVYGILRHREVPNEHDPAANVATACPGILPVEDLIANARILVASPPPPTVGSTDATPPPTKEPPPAPGAAPSSRRSWFALLLDWLSRLVRAAGRRPG